MTVFRQGHPIRRQNQRIATIAIGFRKCAIDGYGVAASLYGRLALLNLDRHVAIDDHALGRIMLGGPVIRGLEAIIVRFGFGADTLKFGDYAAAELGVMDK